MIFINNLKKSVFFLALILIITGFNFIYLPQQKIAFYNVNSHITHTNIKNSYIYLHTKDVSLNKKIHYIIKTKPVFVVKKTDGSNIILNEQCQEISCVNDNESIQLVELNCDDYALVPQVYEKVKIIHPIQMTLINKRRWQITILENKKKIVIDFACGIPNVQQFILLNQTYYLTKQFSYIDLRFKNKISTI